MIISSSLGIRSQPLFYKLDDFLLNQTIYLKLEGLNIGQSIKMTAALGMIESAEREGKVSKNTKFIESSSGNLGVALSMVCKEKNYPFTCVVDPNILPENERLMKLYGAKIIKVTEKDINGGYLGSRINTILKLVENDEEYVWLNQYSNLNNPKAHYDKTALEIYNEIPSIDFLFVGVSTTGTIMGCAQFLKQHSPKTKVIAVDLDGSIIFSDCAKKRFVPGIGASRRPELVDLTYIDDVVLVEEFAAIEACQRVFQTNCLLLGGSSGAVMRGIESYKSKIPINSTVVAIAPDFGFKYIDTVYNSDWVYEKYGRVPKFETGEATL